MYLVSKLYDSNIDNGNSLTSVGEDLKSYGVVLEPCRLIIDVVYK